METNPSVVAKEYRHREWAKMVRECQRRPVGTTIGEWCDSHNIKTDSYYYRLRQVRKACLDYLPAEVSEQDIVKVPAELIHGQNELTSSLDLTVHGAQIHVTNRTSPELLKMVLGVIADVK